MGYIYTRLCVGDTVRLRTSAAKRRRAKPETAEIMLFLSDISGGVRLHTPLDGCRYWNVEDLCLVRRAKKRPRRASEGAASPLGGEGYDRKSSL